MVQPRKYFHPANVYNIYTLEHVEGQYVGLWKILAKCSICMYCTVQVHYILVKVPPQHRGSTENIFKLTHFLRLFL
jgi:hypothetical protein